MARQRRSIAVAVVGVMAAGLWSCGGAADGPTAPVVLQEAPATEPVVTGQDDAGGVSESTFRKIRVCHRGTTLKVGLVALLFHLRHHDRLGACSRVVSCPCFTSEGLEDVAAQCTSSLNASCPQPYSLSLFCSPSNGGGTVGSLGLFEARLGTGTCSTTTQDPMTGIPETTTLPVTRAEFEVCRQAIVGTSFYPGSCPR